MYSRFRHKDTTDHGYPFPASPLKKKEKSTFAINSLIKQTSNNKQIVPHDYQTYILYEY